MIPKYNFYKKNKYKILVASCLLFFSLAINAQIGLHLADVHLTETLDFSSATSLENPPPSLNSIFKSNTNANSNSNTYTAYRYCDLAFFCKIEVQLEKKTKFPVKFRLGTVDYVDYLEGKAFGSQ